MRLQDEAAIDADLLGSINGGAWFGPDAPFGGYKQSGIGREMGVPGLEEFLERKTLAAVIS
jgi:aldehyde dehydrogenase (NAD+)